ncbi:uncharacterized protein LOC117344855 [Pecten maximus]|uniref:uncharacterized protein LOC117344855 n=1 Tax=Pecten maximus TaxID=6579 RepID=UPI001458A88B|nr:uncharacterized protein LOC117344855 [Pecten maximus]
MEDRENGNHKQAIAEKNENVRYKVSPKSTPKSSRKRKQRFCSPKVSPAISIQDGVGLNSEGSTTESEGIQSPIHKQRRLRKNPAQDSPRNATHNENGRNLRGIGDEVQPLIKDNKDNRSCERGNSDTTSHKTVDLTTNIKSPISQSNGHHKLNRSLEKESVGQKTTLEEPDVYMHHKDQSSKSEQQWDRTFIPSQVSRSSNEDILATQKAAEVMARMNCLENDEDILDVEKENTNEGSTPNESSQTLTKISSNGIQKYSSSSQCHDPQGNSYTNYQPTDVMSDQPTEITASQRVESLKKTTKCDVPKNVDLQKKGDGADMNSEPKGTILSSLLEGRDQESLIAAELLTRLDRDIHLSEIQPTICLDQPSYPNYSNMAYGTSSPAQGINVANYLEHKPKKQGSSGTGTVHHNTGVQVDLEHRPTGHPVSCTFESQSGLSVSENGGESIPSASNSLSTPATRQTASQILYHNRTGQEQLGQECQRSHSFHGTVDNVCRDQNQMPRPSDPGALGWEQGQINVPTPQHRNMGIPGWDQRQQSYHQLVDTANQKDPMSFTGALKAGVQHDMASEQLAGEQINNGYRYGPMIPGNSPYTHHSNIGKNKQSEALYERRDHHDAIIPVEQGMPFGPMVEDSHYNGLPTFQSGNYLNLSQETIDNMIQNNQGSSYVGSPSIQSQPLPTNISTPDPTVQGFGDFVSYPRSSQSSEDQYFQPIRSKSQGPDEMLPHMAKRRRRSNSAKTVNNDKSPAFIDVMNNYMVKKKPYEHALHPLQTKDNDSDRFFLILSPEVNSDEVRDIGHKGLIAKYIDYLIVENEQITEMSKAVSIPIEHCVMDDPYLMDIIRVKIPFPTLKYYQWLRTYYPTIQIDWLALNQQMLQFQPVGDCRPHHYILDKRPPPVLLGESFYFFQRERDRLLSC